MATTMQAPAAPLPDLSARRRALPLLVGVALVLGVLVRLWSRSPLWLDEALSVNIATLPLDELPEALRQDGAPPLYYVLLHAWTAVLGTSDLAVRGLSSLCAVAALPLAWLAGTRLRDRQTGWLAVLLLASNPFAVRYATEARMYALVVLLVLAGLLALLGALRDPRPLRLLPVALVSGLLALTHYWAFFLLAVVGGALLVAALRGPDRTAARRCLGALCASGLLFLPWLPSFLYQTAHTGTPWARPPGLGATLTTWQGWAGGSGLPSVSLGLLLLALTAAAVVAQPWRGPDGQTGIVLRLPADRLGTLVAGTALLTLLLGIAVTALQSSGYALRYSAVALVPALLAAALGLSALPEPLRRRATVLAVGLGLAASLPLPLSAQRTQAGQTAALLVPRLAPGDLVVYCPDQLGPSLDRLLPDGTDQVVYPTYGRPERVDWVDYAQRNAQGDPHAFADVASRRADGAVWLVWAPEYRTFEEQCEELDRALQAERGGRQVLQRPRRGYAEREYLVRYP